MKKKILFFILIAIKSWCSTPVTPLLLSSNIRDEHFNPPSVSSLRSGPPHTASLGSPSSCSTLAVGSSQQALTQDQSEVLKSKDLAFNVERSTLNVSIATQQAEIAKLRAEVNRLTNINAALTRQSPSVDTQQTIAQLKASHASEQSKNKHLQNQYNTLGQQAQSLLKTCQDLKLKLKQCKEERDYYDAQVAQLIGECQLSHDRNKTLECMQTQMRAEKDIYLKEKIADYRTICTLKFRNAALRTLCRMQNKTIKKLQAKTFAPVVAPKPAKPRPNNSACAPATTR